MSRPGSGWSGSSRRPLAAGLALLAGLAAGAAAAGSAPDATPGATPDAAALYARNCASCHGAARLGGSGPALLPENLGRLRPAQAARVIAEGRPATQMPGFAGTLSAGEVEALTALIYAPAPTPPQWDAEAIAASRILHADPATLPERPVFAADPLNLFVVVESGDHHVTILDGDRFEPIHRFPSRFALHGGPKFSPDGRFVYFASRDGWVSKFDLYGLRMVAEIRAGINTRNLAVSADGRWVAVANYLPRSLVLLDAADLSLVKLIPAQGLKDKASSRVSAVYDAAPRESFIVALKDIAEVWEIPYGPKARPVYGGLVHSYEKGMEEALPAAGSFPVRRIALDAPLDDFFFDQPYRHLLGSARERGKVSVVQLDVGREIATLALPGLPHLGSGIGWRYEGRPVMATPDLNEGAVSVIDMKDWRLVRRIPTLGPGFFLRSHENTPYAWTDVSLGPQKDALHVIDKRTLEIVRTLRPEPGKTAAHVEFTRDGRYALVSVGEMDGALVVYDAATLEEVKRVPMRKPSGKYNVHNKITRSEGTSH